MNKEIKEILDYISDRVIQKEKWNKVKDYITNLQQENERLKEANKVLEENWEHYMMRCGKAIEYIKYNDSDLYTYDPDYDYEENLVDNYEPSSFREDLLNILQGSDKNE